MKSNPALETLLLGIYIEALENGTNAEQHIIRTAVESLQFTQLEPIVYDDTEDFRGFRVGPYDKLCVKFAELRVAKTFFRAIRRELIQSMPQIYLNARGDQLELPEDPEDEEDTFADRNTANVQILKRNCGTYHTLTFIFSTMSDIHPFLAVTVEINTDTYTTLAN